MGLIYLPMEIKFLFNPEVVNYNEERIKTDRKIIQNNTDWLDVEAAYSITNAYQVKVTCYKNTSSCVRYAEVSVFCKNGDCLKIKVKQNVITGLEDVHNNVSDQPALSPLR